MTSIDIQGYDSHSINFYFHTDSNIVLEKGDDRYKLIIKSIIYSHIEGQVTGQVVCLKSRLTLGFKAQTIIRSKGLDLDDYQEFYIEVKSHDSEGSIIFVAKMVCLVKF